MTLLLMFSKLILFFLSKFKKLLNLILNILLFSVVIATMFLTHYLLYHRVSGRLLGKISHQQQHKQGVELLSVHGKQVSTTRQSPFTAEVRVCVCVIKI